MATRPQGKPASFTAPYSPIIERDKEGGDEDYYPSPRGGGCGCFRRLCCGWDEGGSHSYLLHEKGRTARDETWLVTKLNKLKQLSELVAGPRWKNFIRRIGRICRGKKHTAAQFQYSAESYALNFAGDIDEEEDGHLSHSFSSIFAPRVLISDQQKSAGLR